MSEFDITHGRAIRFALGFASKAFAQIVHAHHHGPAWIEEQVLKSPARIEAAQVVIEWKGDDAHAADEFRSLQSGFQRE